MTPADASSDDELPGTRPPIGSLDELEQLHEEPIELEVAETEEVGLDTEGFDLGEDAAAELVPPIVSGSSRFDDDPLALDPDDDEDGDAPEYGWTEGLEPTDEVENDFEPVEETGALDDGGEDGLLGDDGALDLGELPDSLRGTDEGEDGPIESPDALAVELPG